MAAAGGSQVAKVKREIEACLSTVFEIRRQRRLQPFHYASIRFAESASSINCQRRNMTDRCPVCDTYLGNLPVTKLSQDIFPVKGNKVDAPEVREHEANNPDVTPSSLRGCRFSAEEPLEIDDSAEDYPVQSCPRSRRKKFASTMNRWMTGLKSSSRSEKQAT